MKSAHVNAIKIASWFPQESQLSIVELAVRISQPADSQQHQANSISDKLNPTSPWLETKLDHQRAKGRERMWHASGVRLEPAWARIVGTRICPSKVALRL